MNLKDTMAYLVENAATKVERPREKTILAGLLAGLYIGFAAHAATVASAGWEGEFYGLKKIFAGGVFSLGLILVLTGGAELFTGNCLMPLGLFTRRISWKGMLRNWGLVWAANFAGALLLAFAIGRWSGLLQGEVYRSALSLAAGKAGLTGGEIFIRGVLANVLVCLAVVLSAGAESMGGKVLAILFPVTAFVASGFEHSIANMYFLSAALAAGDPAGTYPALTWANALKNILIATGGNILGGGLLLAPAYWRLFLKGT